MIKRKLNLKRRLFIIIAFISFSAHGQDSLRLFDIVNFESVNIVDRNISENVIFTDFNSYSLSAPYLFYFTQKKDSIVIYNYKVQSKRKIKVKQGMWVGFKVNENYFSVITQKKYNLYSIVTYEIKATSIEEVTKNEVTDYNSYLFSQKSLFKLGLCHSTEMTPVSSIKINNKELSLNFKYPVLTHIQPTNFIDFTEKSTLFSQSTSYDIVFYNNNLQETGVINYRGKDFEGAHKSLLKQIDKTYNPRSPKDVFSNIYLLHQKSDLIWRVNFLSDSVIFVARTDNYGSTSGHMQFVYDLWGRTKDKWGPKYLSIESVFPRDSVVIGKECLPFTLNEVGTRFFFKNNHLYVLKQDIGNPIIGKTIKEYKKLRNDWIIQKNPVLVIYEYKFKDE